MWNVRNALQVMDYKQGAVSDFCKQVSKQARKQESKWVSELMSEWASE